jgi:hypothetical protein
MRALALRWSPAKIVGLDLTRFVLEIERIASASVDESGHRHGAPASPHRDIRCAAFSPTIGRELLELGLIDEIDLHIAPILLGEGIQLYDNPGVSPSVSTGSAKATPRQP